MKIKGVYVLKGFLVCLRFFLYVKENVKGLKMIFESLRDI